MSKHGILKSESMEENAKQLFKLFDENNDGKKFIFILKILL